MLVLYRQHRGRLCGLTGSVRFCCDDMRREWGDLIGFGVKGHPRTSRHEVNIYTLHPQASGAMLPGITEVRHCPWCGEPVEVRAAKTWRPQGKLCRGSL